MKAACESNKPTAEQPKHPCVVDLNSVSWRRFTAQLSSGLAMQQHPHPTSDRHTPAPTAQTATYCRMP